MIYWYNVLHIPSFKVLLFCGYALMSACVPLLKILLATLEQDYLQCSRRKLLNLRCTLKRRLLKTLLHDKLLSNTATCSILLSVISPNAGKLDIRSLCFSSVISAFDERQRLYFTDTHCLGKSCAADVL